MGALAQEPLDFSERTGAALVTGGSGGIGAAICRMLARRGANLVLTYRSAKDRAQQVANECESAGVRAVAVPADLEDLNAVDDVLEMVGTEFGALHTLIYASGPTVNQQHLSTVEPGDYERHLHAEVAAFFNVAQRALPMLRASHGSIVAVTTAATQRYPVRDGLSSGTKAAIDALVRAIAAEEGRFGVRANSVGPGMLTDGMAERLMASGQLDDAALAVTRRNIPLRRFGDADDIAEAVCFLASDRADFISGQLLLVDGGYSV